MRYSYPGFFKIFTNIKYKKGDQIDNLIDQLEIFFKGIYTNKRLSLAETFH